MRNHDLDQDDAIRQDLAKTETPSGGLSADFAPTGLQVYSTFDPHTKKGAKLLVAAMLGDCKQVESMVNKTILLSDYHAHEVETIEDDGEVNKWVRIVVFDNDGTAYQCGSLGVKKSLATMSQIRGPGAFNPPIKVTVRTKRTDNKNLFMWLEPNVDDILSVLKD